MSSDSLSRILFLNRSYWPDAEATGQLLTELCEDLCQDFEVSVLCGQPNQNPGQHEFVESGDEQHQGVHISRVKNSKFPKRSLLGKLINFLSFLWYAFWRVRKLPKPDVVVCETDPFLLPFLAVWIRFRKRCKLVFYLQDIYPDVAIAVGKARNGIFIRLLRRMLRSCYRRADCIVVLSEDMKQTISNWGTLDSVPIKIIPNWIDTTKIVPVKQDNTWRQEHGFDAENLFLIMYSGNLGLSQDLSIVIDAAKKLQDLPELQFVFVGEGASRDALIKQSEGLRNVTFLPYQPRERLAESLSAADLHLLPIRKEALDCLMPSKLYGILASGTAVLSIAPESSELARIIVEEQVGRNLPQFKADPIEQVLRNLSEDRSSLEAAGVRGRKLAETRYDRKVSVGVFKNLLVLLSNRQNPHKLTTSPTVNSRNEAEIPVSAE